MRLEWLLNLYELFLSVAVQNISKQAANVDENKAYLYNKNLNIVELHTPYALACANDTTVIEFVCFANEICHCFLIWYSPHILNFWPPILG